VEVVRPSSLQGASQQDAGGSLAFKGVLPATRRERRAVVTSLDPVGAWETGRADFRLPEGPIGAGTPIWTIANGATNINPASRCSRPSTGRMRIDKTWMRTD
jgi:hypothetical protein